MECTGQFLTTEAIQPQLERPGVKKVVVSAPVKSPGILNIVVGCNDKLYDPSKDHIVTAASCTTNCLAPVVKVIHENLVCCLTMHPPFGPLNSAACHGTRSLPETVCDIQFLHLYPGICETC